MNRHWQDAIHRSMRKRYPMTDLERRFLPRGVRPSRLVHPAECDHCELAYQGHDFGWWFDSLVCLKDLRRLGYEITVG